jgi:(2Fe-2S) ferredoxin
MYRNQSKFKKLVLVCTNERTDGRECCSQKGSKELHLKIKEAVRAVDPAVRVSKSGCLDMCSSGITVVIMPDNVWLGGVTEADIPTVLQYVQR